MEQNVLWFWYVEVQSFHNSHSQANPSVLTLIRPILKLNGFCVCSVAISLNVDVDRAL